MRMCSLTFTSKLLKLKLISFCFLPTIVLLHSFFLLLITESFQGPHEKRLLNNLLMNYNSLERPVANESEPLEVKFGLTLQQIIDVVSDFIYKI